MINWQEKISPAAKQLPDSGLGRFLDIIAVKKNVISLSIGEPDFTTPLSVRKRCIKSVRDGRTSYTSSYGLLQLRQAIAASVEEKYGAPYNPEKEILITTGVSEALDLAVRALLSPGDEVLLPEPCYVAYKACVILAGGVSVPVPTKAEDGFAVNVEELEKRVSAKTKAIIISYPTNPTGATMNREQLLKIAGFAQKHNIVVISDELYAELTYVGRHTCFASLPGMKERTILLNGFSKTYAMTGFRVGFIMAPAEAVSAMLSIHQYTMLCAPTPAQFAAMEAIKSARDDYEFMFDTYNKRRKIMVDGLKRIGLKTFEPQGAFYIFPDIKSTGMSSADFSDRLLEEEEVALIPGAAFGESGEGFVRCSYATSTENLFVALERMDRFVNCRKTVKCVGS
ncbi:MAG: aminotransferase class I/II-fold pyridoxal phosphate-dependent enzyme [Acidaminococcales bacterium]|jgi:aminotransferase|nr:aminotransferase class I/II-fold pyridoxal phosphate-dependent enzyme [Acidaminococcales bacterium]